MKTLPMQYVSENSVDIQMSSCHDTLFSMLSFTFGKQGLKKIWQTSIFKSNSVFYGKKTLTTFL